MGFSILLEVADVAPIAFGYVAVERHFSPQHFREQVFGKVKRLIGWDQVQDIRLQDIDAGVDGVRKHFAPTRLLQELHDRSVVVGDHDTKLQRVWDGG